MAFDDDSTPSPDMAKVLLKSFFSVALGSSIAILAALALQHAIMAWGYPEYSERWFDAFALPHDAFEKTVRDDVDAFSLPTRFFVIAFFSNAVVAVIAGFVSARLAPAGRFGHGVIVAVLLLLNEFQDRSVQRELAPEWYRLLGEFLLPIMVLVGAGICDRLLSKNLDMSHNDPIQ